MRATVTPSQAEVVAGQPAVLAVTLTNTAPIIGGYVLRVLGADPGWVTLEDDRISLFPDETRTVTAKVQLPAGVQAGDRRIAIQVRELTPPEDTAICDVTLSVPAARDVRVTADPLAVTAGKQAGFGLVVANRGNTVIDARIEADDPENAVGFLFDPPIVHVPPGQSALVDMQARARRRIFGSPSVRPLSIYLDDLGGERFFDSPTAADPSDAAPAARDERQAVAVATFIQKALVSRGLLGLVGLLVAASVFAVTIALGMSQVAQQSSADRDVALRVLAAQQSGAASGTGTLSGKVTLLTNRKHGESGVSVAVYDSSDLTKPVATAASDNDGAWTVSELPAGQYKVSFQGASFVELWYPDSPTPDAAKAITLADGATNAGVDVAIGGTPVAVNGTVNSPDAGGATLYLEAKPTGSGASSPQRAAVRALQPDSASTPGASSGLGPDGLAIVQKTVIGSDGSFSLAGVPSPGNYELVLTKPGFATATQPLAVAAGEARGGISLTLQRGDGSILGAVSDGTHPLSGVTLTATSGSSLSSTVSLTGTKAGTFTLRNLPTPAGFTVIASKPGYTSQTLTLDLSAAQQLRGVVVTLGKASGTVTGRVKTPKGISAAGIAVAATDGSTVVSTVTAADGSWTLANLPAPGTYTVTFTGDRLAPATVSAALDSAGHISGGSGVSIARGGALDVTMAPADGTVVGRIRQRQPNAAGEWSGRYNFVGQAAVTLTAGGTTYSVTSSSTPANQVGRFTVDGVAPGTYTLTVTSGSGTSPYSQPLTVTAGPNPPVDVRLDLAASVQVQLVKGAGVTTDFRTWTVFLYAAANYPAGPYRTGSVTVTGSGALGTSLFNGVDAGQYVVVVGPTVDPTNGVQTRFVTVDPGTRTRAVARITKGSLP